MRIVMVYMALLAVVVIISVELIRSGHWLAGFLFAILLLPCISIKGGK